MFLLLFNSINSITCWTHFFYFCYLIGMIASDQVFCSELGKLLICIVSRKYPKRGIICPSLVFKIHTLEFFYQLESDSERLCIWGWVGEGGIGEDGEAGGWWWGREVPWDLLIIEWKTDFHMENTKNHKDKYFQTYIKSVSLKFKIRKLKNVKYKFFQFIFPGS